jgi:O-antigen ligase
MCGGLVATHRPWRVPSVVPRLDGCLLLVAAAIGLQLVPLPVHVIDVVSPSARPAWERLTLTAVRGPLPISVNLWSTTWALAVYLGALAVFILGRQTFAHGGVRTAVRGLATIGLVLSAEALAQAATARRLIYWIWKTPFDVALPFGPFLNRNHFATWAIMAIPLCAGYLRAHHLAHRDEAPAERSRRAAVSLGLTDSRSIWLAASICFMLVALVASLSRAGWAGLAAGWIAGSWLQRGRRGSTKWVAAAVLVALAAGAIVVAPTDLIQRATSIGTAASGRLDIWRATMPVVRDFWVTGTGAGTFETVMLVYQRVPSLFRINAAHNHYLQIAAEGGLLVGVPAAAALVLFARQAWAALEHDDSAMYLVRAGAASGLVAAAVQSVWETGLTTPANALLAALCAAIALHRPPRAGRTR